MGWAMAQGANPHAEGRGKRECEALTTLLAPHLAEPAEAAELAQRLLHRCGGFATVIGTPAPHLRAAAPGLPDSAIALLGRLGEAAESLSRATALIKAGRMGTALGARGVAASPSAPGGASRVAAGQWLRRLREGAALSQAELAARLGYPSPTLVDQIEAGHGRIAWARAAEWADALGIARPEFAAGLVRLYEPELAALLGWSVEPTEEAAPPEEAARDTAA